jgi:HTH-type transcriptional regulator/antitoxin HigA
MQIKPIRNDADLTAAFVRLESVFQAEVGTPEADEMGVLIALIEAFENKHYPIVSTDPVKVIN